MDGGLRLSLRKAARVTKTTRSLPERDRSPHLYRQCRRGHRVPSASVRRGRGGRRVDSAARRDGLRRQGLGRGVRGRPHSSDVSAATSKGPLLVSRTGRSLVRRNATRVYTPLIRGGNHVVTSRRLPVPVARSFLPALVPRRRRIPGRCDGSWQEGGQRTVGSEESRQIELYARLLLTRGSRRTLAAQAAQTPGDAFSSDGGLPELLSALATAA